MFGFKELHGPGIPKCHCFWTETVTFFVCSSELTLAASLDGRGYFVFEEQHWNGRRTRKAGQLRGSPSAPTRAPRCGAADASCARGLRWRPWNASRRPRRQPSSWGSGFGDDAGFRVRRVWARPVDVRPRSKRWSAESEASGEHLGPQSVSSPELEHWGA